MTPLKVVRNAFRAGCGLNSPTMLAPDCEPLPPGRPFVDDLDDCDRRFGVAPSPRAKPPRPVEPPETVAPPSPPFGRRRPGRPRKPPAAPDAALPLPPRKHAQPWRVGYSAALPSLRFTITGEAVRFDYNATPLSAFGVIVGAVARVFWVQRADLLSERRCAGAALRARIALYALLREFTTWSLPRIGRAIGGRHHTTVHHGIRRAEELRGRDPDFAAKLAQARAIVAANAEEESV